MKINQVIATHDSTAAARYSSVISRHGGRDGPPVSSCNCLGSRQPRPKNRVAKGGNVTGTSRQRCSRSPIGQLNAYAEFRPIGTERRFAADSITFGVVWPSNLVRVDYLFDSL